MTMGPSLEAMQDGGSCGLRGDEHLSDISSHINEGLPSFARRSEDKAWWQEFPWWGSVIALVMLVMAAKIFFDPDYDLAWSRIYPGVWLTLQTTFISFGIAFILGLLAGIGQISQNVVAHNLSRAYVELIRGIPILPLIFTVALVLVPKAINFLHIDNSSVSTKWRVVVALSLIYGAYMAEIFRGGIQSVAPGQREAGRSLGLSHRQTMSTVVIPQAMRAIIPPLGNDFIAILKDTSLFSVLGVLELTRRARQYSASSFKFPETYFTLTFIYLCLVIGLSILLGQFEKYMTKDRKGER